MRQWLCFALAMIVVLVGTISTAEAEEELPAEYVGTWYYSYMVYSLELETDGFLYMNIENDGSVEVFSDGSKEIMKCSKTDSGIVFENDAKERILWGFTVSDELLVVSRYFNFVFSREKPKTDSERFVFQWGETMPSSSPESVLPYLLSNLQVTVDPIAAYSGHVFYIDDDFRITWTVDGQAEAYIIVLYRTYSDEPLVISKTKETMMSVPLFNLTDETYNLRVGAIVKGGGAKDIIWSSCSFANIAIMPTPQPTVSVSATMIPESENATRYTTIEVGSQGDHVKALQERLVALGYLVNEEGALNGKAGAKVEAAVKAAQTKAGMTVNGVADEAFQEYIFSDDAVRAN